MSEHAASARGARRSLCGLLLLALLVLTACGSALDSAIRATNAARAEGMVAHDSIEATCPPAYDDAETPEKVAAVDEYCVPAADAYEAFAAAHRAAVAAIQTAQAAKDQSAVAAILKTAQQLAEAGRALAESVSKLVEAVR